MLDPADLVTMTKLLRDDATPERVAAEARDIRRRLNPHPGGQLSLNVPDGGDRPLDGLQHKYAETALFFPGPGQMCHGFCTYCFRWAQFVGEPDLRMAGNDPEVLCDYLRRHPEVGDVLLTGGDPMIMRTEVLARFPSGRQLAVMAHHSHPRELGPEVAREAVRRIRAQPGRRSTPRRR
jgi:L-lysine 2,3-aminomutase